MSHIGRETIFSSEENIIGLQIKEANSPAKLAVVKTLILALPKDESLLRLAAYFNKRWTQYCKDTAPEITPFDIDDIEHLIELKALATKAQSYLSHLHKGAYVSMDWDAYRELLDKIISHPSKVKQKHYMDYFESEIQSHLVQFHPKSQGLFESYKSMIDIDRTVFEKK